MFEILFLKQSSHSKIYAILIAVHVNADLDAASVPLGKSNCVIDFI